MIEPGIYVDLSSEDYHSDKNSISRSSLLDFKKSARKYWANHLNPDRPPKEYTPALIFGHAFHTMILEPDLFKNEYLIMNEKVLKKDDPIKYEINKELEKEAETTKKQVLSFADYKRLRDMRDAVRSNEKALKLISGAIYESSYFWQDEHSGLMLKARPDVLHSNIYVDLKTIDNASPDNFQRSMALYSNHVQAAMVRDGIKALTGETISACINICVEKTYPYSVGIYFIDEKAIEHGHMEYKQLLLNLKESLQTNEFQDYPISTIGLPKWYT